PSHGREFLRALRHAGARDQAPRLAPRAPDERQAGPKVAPSPRKGAVRPPAADRRERTPMFFASIALAAAAVTVPSAGHQAPHAPRLDEALFFLADVLQDSGKDDEAVAAARELTRRFPKSTWAPASHVFVGEHLFDKGKVAQALVEYRAAAEDETDDVYPYAL